jgi:hypothetical protein
LVSERCKQLAYHEINVNRWRTHAQQEVDYIEERNGQIKGFEFKWNSSVKARIPKTFTDAYPGSLTMIVTPDNFRQFLSP